MQPDRVSISKTTNCPLCTSICEVCDHFLLGYVVQPPDRSSKYLCSNDLVVTPFDRLGKPKVPGQFYSDGFWGEFDSLKCPAPGTWFVNDSTNALEYIQNSPTPAWIGEITNPVRYLYEAPSGMLMFANVILKGWNDECCPSHVVNIGNFLML